MANIKKDIKYIDRDFNSFKEKLKEFSKSYFPDTYNDFSEESTGMLFMEMSSYIGDILSFYLDTQIQETFLEYAEQLENVYSLAYGLGYTPKITTVSSVDIDFYQQLPATTSGSTTIPDFSYCLNVPENTQIVYNKDNNIKFLIEDPIDFSSSSSLDPTEITVYQILDNTPTYYLIKKTRKAISATINSTTLTFGSSKKYDSKTINSNNIIGILDVYDSEGNRWYEVPNLAQENVFDSIRNTNVNDPNIEETNDVPYLLQLKQVQRRFCTRFSSPTALKLEFGAGSTGFTDEEIIPNPDNVGLGLPFQKNKLTTAFSPVNFVFTNTYGLAPSNTNLTVRYLTGGGLRSNVEANSLTIIDDTNVKFNNPNLSNDSLANLIFNSLASNNPKASDGGGDGDSLEEIKQNAYGNYQNQLRSVTPNDYLIRALSMPSNLGSISKAILKPTNLKDSQVQNLDFYILSYDINKKLKTASDNLKRNLKTYLSEYRMINDHIYIKDAFIINIGINFDIIVLPNYNNSEVLTKCIEAIQTYFNIDLWQINEPIILKDIYILLDKVDGVQTVKNVEIINKTGANLGYSDYAYDIKGATINNVIYPSLDPMIFELKDANVDIKGRVVPL